MVGSAICRRLNSAGYTQVLTVEREVMDLRQQATVDAYFSSQEIDVVIVAAAKVGGIYANQSLPAEFLYDNLMIEANLIEAAHRHGVQRLLFLGSSCIYPRDAEQPIREEALLGGPLESTNAPYAIAKIAGIALCESYCRQYGCDYRSLMPTNLYGPGDNFHPEHAHVIPALVRRFYEAVSLGLSEVVVWGSGSPRREFLHVDDLADAAVFVMELDQSAYRAALAGGVHHINVGTGQDCSIRELVERLAVISGYKGALRFDPSKPDGTPRKLLDVARLTALGWRPTTDFSEGLAETYRWFVDHRANVRG